MALLALTRTVRHPLFARSALALLFCASSLAADSLYEQGKHALEAKAYSDAEQYLDRAEKQAPGTTNALALRGKALINLNRFADAEACLRTFLTQHPDSADGAYLLAYVLFRENRPADSLAQYTQAARLKRPTADDFKIVGLDYVLLKDYPDAIKWLQQSVSENPGNAETLYYLGRAYYVQNTFDRAIDAFNRALSIDAQMIKAQENLGLAYEGKNDLQSAEACYRAAIRLASAQNSSDTVAYVSLADLLRRTGREADAIPLLDAADRAHGPSPKSEEIRGRILLEQNRLAEAEAQIRAAVAGKPQDGPLHYLLGRVLKREGKSTEAEQEFAQTRKLTSATSEPN